MMKMVLLVHSNVANNVDNQQNSRVFHIFIPNKQFGISLHISPK